MYVNTKFWDNFLLLCQKAGKSPSRVCGECGISRASVTTWKNGSVPRNATISVIAKYFGVSPNALLKDDMTESHDNTPATSPAADLTDTEQMVLNLWRKVPDEKRPQVLMEYMAMLKDKGLL